MKCRHCESQLEHLFVDLGFAPPSNAYLSRDDLSKPEIYYPLRVLVCETCWLVQTEDYAHADELFKDDYAYFSSTSSTWLEHSRHYSEMIIKRLGLNDKSFVVEVASNDGYLLRNFLDANIPCLGVEPTASTAEEAESLGIQVVRRFFNEDVAREISNEFGKADLIIGNNVYAHVPDINGFTRAIAILLKPEGVVTLEFPHLLNLVEKVQFDTIYHEHFSYLSLNVVNRIFRASGLEVWDVEVLPTHGGSLRVYGGHNGRRPVSAQVHLTMTKETVAGLENLECLSGFQHQVHRVKYDLLMFLIEQKRIGNRVVGYGAAAKGNTLLNFSGVTSDLLPVVYDSAKAKQRKFLPGSHIPIRAASEMADGVFDAVLILPWNISAEVRDVVAGLIRPAPKFVLAIPHLAEL